VGEALGWWKDSYGTGEVSFSEQFGWLEDKFGVSWQLNLASRPQKITPFFLFVGEQHGKAEEAIHFYVSLFQNSGVTRIERYGAGEEEPEGTVKHATFSLNGQEFMAMESKRHHPFTFTPAISFFVDCQTQEDVDKLWTSLLSAENKNNVAGSKTNMGCHGRSFPRFWARCW